MRRLNLDQLQALSDVVALGSFSAAANKLHLTQPAVSLQIRELEQRHGVKLIERMGKRAYATAAGEALIAHTRRLTHEAELALNTMRRFRDGWVGRVRLGTSAAVCTYLLPPVLVALRKAHPTLEPVISTGTTEDVITQILANELDIGLVTMPVKRQSTIEVEPLRDDPMMAYFPGDERNLPKQVTPQYLTRRNLIIHNRLSHTYKMIARWFEQAGVEPQPIMEFSSSEALKAFVATGVGVGILPLESNQSAPVFGSTQVRPLRPALMRKLAIVRRQDKPMDVALNLMYEALLTLGTRRRSLASRDVD